MKYLLQMAACCSATQLVVASPLTLQPACSSASIVCHDLPDIEVLNIIADQVNNFKFETSQIGDIPAANWTNLNFCNVTVTYTHPSRNDTINVNTWLPLEDQWNGRFQGTGGASYVAGLGPESLAPAVAAGYAASSTDAGLIQEDASTWALLRPGEVDRIKLEDFASVSLNDLSLIGKAVTESYYGRPPSHSYWSGCSTGGRQGMMLAQRYPEAFDGVLALAPAINWPPFVVADYWPQLIMNQLKYYPRPCELEYLTAAAIEACDELDGLRDGVVSRPDLCTFTAKHLIGTKNLCSGEENTVTAQAAAIADAAWSGPTGPSGQHLWPPYHIDAPLTGLPGISLAFTNCTGLNRSSCVPEPFPVSEEWITLFVEKDPKFDPTKMTNEEYAQIFHRSVAEYQHIIGTANPDLSAFKQAGGKILSWHGLADQLIAPSGTALYYDAVLGQDPAAADFYRLFFAPNTWHCQAGSAPYPYDSLQVLVDWVENGVAPDTLTAVNRTVAGDRATRPLCLYPKVQTYVAGDGETPASFTCV